MRDVQEATARAAAPFMEQLSTRTETKATHDGREVQKSLLSTASAIKEMTAGIRGEKHAANHGEKTHGRRGGRSGGGGGGDDPQPSRSGASGGGGAVPSTFPDGTPRNSLESRHPFAYAKGQYIGGPKGKGGASEAKQNALYTSLEISGSASHGGLVATQRGGTVSVMRTKPKGGEGRSKTNANRFTEYKGPGMLVKATSHLGTGKAQNGGMSLPISSGYKQPRLSPTQSQ